MRTSSRRGKRATLFAWLAFAYLFFVVCDLREFDVSAPLHYNGDILDAYAVYGRDTSVNDLETRLYAPFNQARPNATDTVRNLLFQPNANLNLLAYLATGDAMTASNVYYLLTYVLAFGIAYWVLGRLKLRDPLRFAAATLYALMPFHFQRGAHHILESSYYLTPLLVLILLWMWSARPLFSRWDGAQWKTSFTDRRTLFALIVVAFLSSFHYYHQFFFALLAGCTAISACAYRRSARHLWTGLAIAAFAVAVLVGKGVLQGALRDPQLALSLSGASFSPYGEAEHYPLKIIQILLPVEGHRWPAFAVLRSLYDGNNDLVNENSTASLGLVGAVGFMLSLLACIPTRSRVLSVASKFGFLTLAVLLIATMGGFSSVISTASMTLFGADFELTQARAWNRMSIYIGFFAYTTFFLALQWALRRLAAHRGWRMSPTWLASLVCIPVLAFALWDQVPYKIGNDPAGVAAYRSDQAFFKELEARLPDGADVLQLPLVINHASGSVNGVYYTDAFRPYLASHDLRFSFGGDPGSTQSQWLKTTLALPNDRMLARACAFGFEGVLVHRPMIAAPETVEAPLRALLGAAQVSPRNDFAFFALAPYCAAHHFAALDPAAAKARALAEFEAASRITDFGVDVLSHQVGNVDAAGKCLVSDGGAAGFLGFGPYASFEPGAYVARFDVAATQAGAAKADVATNASGLQVLGVRDVPDAGGVEIPFTVADRAAKYEFRVATDGRDDVRYCGVQVRRTSR